MTPSRVGLISVVARRLWWWGPPLAQMAVIFYLSAQSDPLPTLTAAVSDKDLHSFGYAILGALLARALAASGWNVSSTWLGATLFASLYGASDEFHQSFVAGRDADVLDWIADTCGAFVGGGGWLLVLALWRKYVRAPDEGAQKRR